MGSKCVIWSRVFIELGCIMLIIGMVSVVYKYRESRLVSVNNSKIKQDDNLKNKSDSMDKNLKKNQQDNSTKEENDYIKWVDFKVTCEALNDAYRYDKDSYIQGKKRNWIELLAYLACRYGGDFGKYKKKDMDELIDRLDSGVTIKDITKDMKYYSYYYEAYSAVLGGMVGKIEKNGVKEYGIKAYFPIAKYFPYSHYDDFGASRSYGYKRKHLGHDMFGQVGTPIIAVESGVVEALGWNQYGGWRLGIRSFDKKRYYYYAHLRKNFPFNKSLKQGSVVTAGDVIGYMGRTGYSSKENVNNIDVSHLHFGIQLIFDESQKEGNNEIWVDCYQICKFLYLNRSETVKNEETKEYSNVDKIVDEAVIKYNKVDEKRNKKNKEH